MKKRKAKNDYKIIINEYVNINRALYRIFGISDALFLFYLTLCTL